MASEEAVEVGCSCRFCSRFDKYVPEEETLPIIDIDANWQRVSLDAVMATICSMPALGLIATPYFLYWYSYRPRLLLLHGPLDVLNEVLLWLFLLWIGYSSISDGSNYYDLLKSGYPQVAFESLQVNVIFDACATGAVLLWRILQVHAIEVSGHVRRHKREARELLEENESARRILGTLQGKSPYNRFFRKGQSACPAERMSKPREKNCTVVEQIVIILSTLSMMLGMTFFKLQIDGRVSEALGDPLAPMVLGAVLTVIMSTKCWYSFIAGVLNTSRSFSDNTNQMLLFTALTKKHHHAPSAHMWSMANLRSLTEILAPQPPQGCYSACGVVECSHDVTDELSTSAVEPERPVSREKPRERIRESLRADGLSLDLLDHTDVQAWWELRRYIQVDFVDESAIMDSCVAMTAILLASLGVGGVLDWLVNRDLFSKGFLLLVVLACALSFAMHRGLEACIAINSLLQRDARVLSDAALEVLMHEKTAPSASDTSNTNGSNLVSADLLLALQRKVEAFDDQQRIFGIPITAQLRNGWLASLLLALLPTAWKLLKPWLMRIQLDSVEDKLDLQQFQWLAWVDILKNFTTLK
ncbi:unnamed protein product [Effrenium voratum]|nr:unnamed protein product [Effrenium voratum]